VTQRVLKSPLDTGDWQRYGEVQCACEIRQTEGGYAFMPEQAPAHTIVIISANTEWRVVRSQYPEPQLHPSPLGNWFVVTLDVGERVEPVIFFHGGWGKIAAAASTQYAIDRWSPVMLINLGTCGGFEGAITKGTILLVERTIVYDIVEMMSDYEAAIASYTTTLDLSWLGESVPHEVQRSLLVSADRDVQVGEIAQLKARYGAIAGDWESGAIAYIAARNNVRCLILRGVTDLIGETGEAYGNVGVFRESTEKVFQVLLRYLPAWIALAKSSS
jgi:adenosylhomocysteine nucleosidase